ncbi:MAG: alpha/beta fold hydrolase [Bacteroidetes bacterium]|nr:MAG: alpha/beta fold hydrolase [Bacteroidota bacterium]REJ99677.1 MAG: alpha/beta fold hydrolase [Bacteroidota bacterium]REK33910.1 MAG: alpha/beta fold hydrolase [Bacteroidota bacterium]REK47675.1 MAG: alpha/beta fold hydrolase [Bacteroidota bacterium]
MKNFIILLLSLILHISVSKASDTAFVARTEKVLEFMLRGDFKSVSDQFDSTLAARISEKKLGDVWRNLIKNYGNFVKVKDVNSEAQPKYDVVTMRLELEKTSYDMRVVYGKENMIKGLFFSPTEKRKPYEPPAYADFNLFKETATRIETGDLKLAARYAMPNGAGPFPAVVLIHGSGPNDKDESVGGTKIFRDLAFGLASKGVAVLRYDKRTKVYPAKIKESLHNLTVKEEVIEDVISAVNLLSKDSMIDPNRIYLLGHSMGGMLLPRIVKQTASVKGLIYLAANCRPLEEQILLQANHLSTHDTSGKGLSAVLDSIRSDIGRIKALTEKSRNDTSVIMHLPVSYWLDLKNYDPLAQAKLIEKPMLFLHGGRDYQVNDDEYNLWKSGLDGKKGVEFRYYPELNHFLVKGSGVSMPSEYNIAANMEEQVIDDIVTFIMRHK